MDFHLDRGVEAFRQEVRGFLQRELPAGWRGFSGVVAVNDEEWSLCKEFTRKLSARGWLTVSWPTEYGGGGRSLWEQLAHGEEMAYHRAPTAAHHIAVDIVGPVLIAYGNQELKRDYLWGISSGEFTISQGFSEPDAGSDLSALKTRAVERGGAFTITGKKVFVTYAHRSNLCWLLAKTGFEPGSRRGFSTFIVDMTTPGITVRPLINMLGQHYFDEVFFDDVRVPERCLVGEKDQGWEQVLAALNFERFGYIAWASAQRTLEELIDYVRDRTCGQKTVFRHKLAEIGIEIGISRLLFRRIIWMQSRGTLPSWEASLAKVFDDQLNLHLAQVGMDILGLYGQLEPISKGAPLHGSMEQMYLWYNGFRFARGTWEVQRNLIARRGLGLPRA